MNQKEWKKSGKFKGKYEWYNNTRKIQKSLQYNDNPKAVVIHHLRDTEEQRKYNDEHYELWGHNLDGTFEYGKYVVFVTKEEHDSYHQSSDETRKKRSTSLKMYWTPERRSIWKPGTGRVDSEETRRKRVATFLKTLSEHPEIKLKISKSQIGKHFSDEAISKMRESAKRRKPRSEESLRKQSESMIKVWYNTSYRERLSELQRNSWNDERREHMSTLLTGHEVSEETRKKISEANSGRKFTEEHKQKLSISAKNRPSISEETRHKLSTLASNRVASDETRKKLSQSKMGNKNPMYNIGENHPMYGKHHSEEAKRLMSESAKKDRTIRTSLYRQYKSAGGIFSWNKFQSLLKNGCFENILNNIKNELIDT
jgi:hypothetical protein